MGILMSTWSPPRWRAQAESANPEGRDSLHMDASGSDDGTSQTTHAQWNEGLETRFKADRRALRLDVLMAPQVEPDDAARGAQDSRERSCGRVDGATRRKSILFVDDDEAMRAVIEVILSVNYCVTLAIDGVDGYMKANEQPKPDLIITDVSMPKLDGIAMVRRIRENSVLHRVPVIFLTGQTSPASVIAGLSVGSFAYLSKPTTSEVLERKVKSALWH